MIEEVKNAPSPWAALKRRKIVQWAIAYAAAAWALLQVLSLLAATFHWPEATMRVAVGVAVAGFFITLILSWYHGERGAQGVTRGEFALLALCLLLGSMLSWRLAREEDGRDATQAHLEHAKANAGLADASAPAKSIAVLPFQNLSADQENAYFASGIQDLILTRLSEIAELQVSSRTSTEKFRTIPEDVRAVGQQLGVATILEGSVQKAGNQVMINVQLIDAATDKHVWAQAYTRTLDNIFGVEGEVAQTIAAALKAKLTPQEADAIAKLPTANKQAYDLHLRALYFLDSYNLTLDRDQLEQAAAFARQATDIDPNFADAFSVLALAYAKLGDHMAEQVAAARRAVALQPNSAGSHRQMAYLLSKKGEHAAAMAEAEQTRRLAPGTTDSFLALGITLARAGRFDEAGENMRQLIKLEPKQNFDVIWLAAIERARRRYAEARDALLPAVARNPSDISAASDLAVTYILGWGDLSEARRVLKNVATPSASSAALSIGRYRIELWSRNPVAARAVLAAVPNAAFAWPLPPRELLDGLAYQVAGDAAQAKTSYMESVAVLRPALAAHADSADAHAFLALALAGLRQDEEAIALARNAVELQPISLSAVDNPQYLLYLAQVYARTGHAGEAIELLRQLLDMPAGDFVSIPLLKLDPALDPLRSDRGFEALLARPDNGLKATPSK